jgi:hypothetical protein
LYLLKFHKEGHENFKLMGGLDKKRVRGDKTPNSQKSRVSKKVSSRQTSFVENSKGLRKVGKTFSSRAKIDGKTDEHGTWTHLMFSILGRLYFGLSFLQLQLQWMMQIPTDDIMVIINGTMKKCIIVLT